MSKVGGTAYDLAGPKDADVVVLIHGLGLCRKLWNDHLGALSEYRVLTYDLWGHGESDPAPGAGTLTLYSDQLAELLVNLGIAKAHVIGFSIGGMINRRFAMDYENLTKSLVVLNSPHDRGEEAQKTVEDRALRVREQGAFSTFDEALKRWFTPVYLNGNGQGASLVRAWRGQVDAESYAAAAWVLAHGVVELIRPKVAITVPTLIMTCEHDSGSTPAMSHAIQQEINGAHCEIIPELQHLGLMERPELFAQPILKFLKGQSQNE